MSKYNHECYKALAHNLSENSTQRWLAGLPRSDRRQELDSSKIIWC